MLVVEDLEDENSEADQKHQMNPTLYYVPPSPPCRAVLILGRMLNIEFDLKEINILEGDQLKPEFVQLNPQHTIPTLQDHNAGIVLWESRVILTYLTSVYAKEDSLYPHDVAKRALVDQRLAFDHGTLYQRMVDYFFPTMMMGAHLDETKKAKLAEALMWYEEILAKGTEYAASDYFSLADLSLCVTVSQIEAFDFDMYPYPLVKKWLQRCKSFMDYYGYDELNKTGAETLAALFRSKLKHNFNDAL